MSTVTPFINLVKPAPLEQFSRSTYNTNLDLIDAAMLAETTKMKHAEWERIGQNDAPANTPWGPGPFGTAPLNKVVDKNSGFVVAGAGNDQLKVTEEGVYTFSWTIFQSTGTTHGFWMRIGDPGNAFQYAVVPLTNVPTGEFVSLSAPNFWMPANTTFQVRFQCTGNMIPINHRFRLTKSQG